VRLSPLPAVVVLSRSAAITMCMYALRRSDSVSPPVTPQCSDYLALYEEGAAASPSWASSAHRRPIPLPLPGDRVQAGTGPHAASAANGDGAKLGRTMRERSALEAALPTSVEKVL